MRRYAVVLAAVVLTIGASAVAIAAIPDSNGVIHACRDNRTGALRVIDTEAGQTCSSKESALYWNQTGPQGPPGLSGYEVRTQTFTTGFGSGLNVDVSCGSKSVLGGGYDVTGVTGLSVTASHPHGNGWRITFTYSGAGQVSFDAWAICANVN
jgi:hypothetical protein